MAPCVFPPLEFAPLDFDVAFASQRDEWIDKTNNALALSMIFLSSDKRVFDTFEVFAVQPNFRADRMRNLLFPFFCLINLSMFVYHGYLICSSRAMIAMCRDIKRHRFFFFFVFFWQKSLRDTGYLLQSQALPYPGNHKPYIVRTA